MTKNTNMGRRSHQEQDAQLKQNMAGMQDEIGEQQTRPYVSKQQATKKGKEMPRNTK
jgi:hypothetical protein